jgi:integrase
VWGEKPRRSYAEAVEKFIREHLTTIKLRAAKRYGDSLKHLSEHFGDKTLDQITSAELSSFETKRREDGVSTSTIRRDLACLSSMLTSCVDWEWIDANIVPAYLRRRSKRGLKEGAARTRYLTESEELKLLQAASPDVRRAIVLAIDTGLRREELFSLQWNQIDSDRGIITTTTKTKSGRARSVPLPERSLDMILPRHDGYVLINPDTGKRYLQMNKGFKAAIRRAGIAHTQWHDLRRTAAVDGSSATARASWKSLCCSDIHRCKSLRTVTHFLESERVAASIGGRTKTGTVAA